jgi:membrane protein
MAREAGQNAAQRERTAPDPEDPRKPDELPEIRKRSWIYVLKKTAREFGTDQATDLAAALTYYAVLAIFPALLAFVSIIGLFGDPQETTESLLDLLGGLVPPDVLGAIREPISSLASSPAAGFAFVTGVVGALWSASGYVGAFARAMNRIYSIQEGRPFWKLRPTTLAVTVLAVVVAVVAALMLTLSGPIAEEVGQSLGLGETGLIVWNIVRWPILLFLVVLVVAVLYYATPNVQQPRFRWMSLGALLAIVVWILASAAFAFYAANFSNYNATYGSIGGVIVALLWIWITNLALLFGAELDAELERGRELQGGIEAEEHIQLPPRDTKVSDKKEAQHEKDVREGRELRTGIPEPDPDEKAAQERKDAGAATKRMKRAARSLQRTTASTASQLAAPKPTKKD